jgi:hypothetical protein
MNPDYSLRGGTKIRATLTAAAMDQKAAFTQLMDSILRFWVSGAKKRTPPTMTRVVP